MNAINLFASIEFKASLSDIKSRILIILLIIFLQFPVRSQDWSLQNNYTTYPGTVGVGMDSMSIPRGILEMISNTNKAEVFIKGAGSSPVNAGIVLQSTNSTNTRSTGIFMHDELGQNEWYMGRPYKNSDRFVIFRNPGTPAHTHWSSGLRDGGNNPTGVSAMMAILPNGKTGIGTDLPEAKLDIKSSGTLGARFDPSDAYLRIGDGTIDMVLDGNEITSNHLLALGSAYGHDISFRNVDATSHEHLMTIKSNGNVGIGVTNPSSKLDIKRESSETLPHLNFVDGEYSIGAFSSSDGYGLNLKGITAVNSATTHPSLILSGYTRDYAADHTYDAAVSVRGYDVADNSALQNAPIFKVLNAASSAFLTVNANGKVGIGTTNPTTKLDIKDGVVKAGTSDATHGTVQFAGSYVGSNALNTYGSQYSSGATSIGYGVQQKHGSQGIVSSAENSSFKRGMLILDEELKFLNAGSSTVPIGNDIAMVTRFMVKESGNVGIGVSAPAMKLQIGGSVATGYNNIMSLDPNEWYNFTNNSGYGSINWFSQANSTNSDYINTHATVKPSAIRGGNGEIKFFTSSVNNGIGQSSQLEQRLVIDSQGKVGIGTTAPTQKLSVAGTIASEELLLEDVQGADFVFEEDYDLRSLEETEQFIKANKHLPEIPSAAEMAEEGLAIKEMNILLLQKVEELTLHLIRMEKVMQEQQIKIEALEQTQNNK